MASRPYVILNGVSPVKLWGDVPYDQSTELMTVVDLSGGGGVSRRQRRGGGFARVSPLSPLLPSSLSPQISLDLFLLWLSLPPSHQLILYSIAISALGDFRDSKNVSLCVKRLVYTNENGEIVKGVCSNFLCDLKPGSEVTITGPVGKEMLMPKDPSASIIMVHYHSWSSSPSSEV
ncbi:uncharacterized protein LOC110268455 [Arachis ipaensis]|uniref:uncharacterized protein LOC110268455 n=1 Tax=Arachis ipaensis TaxID=130454 RepID=UPI000A2B64AB|nr:uncharacterized protein LOC110268455 [Arachis ipaensis]